MTVTVNHEPKGEFIVLLAQDGDVLIRQEDFAQFQVAPSRAGVSTVEGAQYVSLRSIPGLNFEVDIQRLTLRIQVDARALARRQVFDASPRRRGDVIHPAPAGAFLNYNLSSSGDDRTRFHSSDAAMEAGVRLGSYLLLTDGIARHARDGIMNGFTRLSTSAIRDDRESLQRLVAGDFVALSGALGSSMRLGGVSLSRRYTLDPYLVRFPGQIVSGTATLPSEVLLYNNGVLVRRERVAPGTFELQNLVSLGGLQVTEVVIRDVLGNEQRIVNPFYFTDALLRAGLDEYSVDAGLERRQFGLRSNDYGKAGFSSFYRRGVNDDLTLGVRGEALDGRTNVGPTAAWRAGIYGVASGALSFGQGPAGSGPAWLYSHAYTSARFSASLAVRGEARNYARAVAEQTGARKSDLAASIAMPLGPATSISALMTRVRLWNAPGSRSAGISLRQRISRDLSVGLSFTEAKGPSAANELLLSFFYTFDAFGERPAATAQLRRTGTVDASTLQVAGGKSEGEGLLYRATFERSSGPTGPRDTINPFLQYNFRSAVGRAEYFRDSTSGVASHQVGLAGAIANVGGEWGLARPILDSFGIAKLEGVPGVRVYANNQEAGRTDAAGKVFIPRLASYFDNPISIEQADLPVEFIVPEVRYIVSPGFRSGVAVDFKTRRVRAVAGRLVTKGAAGVTPFAAGEGEVDVPGGPAKLYTSRDGSFYIDDLGPGRYRGRARSGLEACNFELNVPESTEVVSELGEVLCNGGR